MGVAVNPQALECAPVFLLLDTYIYFIYNNLDGYIDTKRNIIHNFQYLFIIHDICIVAIVHFH